mmetsp:Transcript_71869/g.159840  ORF Transcript_71869/g.159840 Transcript_71869/m.159840 type:complete len:222 (-) Transcript_71869:467-1132(-)
MSHTDMLVRWRLVAALGRDTHDPCKPGTGSIHIESAVPERRKQSAHRARWRGGGREAFVACSALIHARQPPLAAREARLETGVASTLFDVGRRERRLPFHSPRPPVLVERATLCVYALAPTPHALPTPRLALALRGGRGRLSFLLLGADDKRGAHGACCVDLHHDAEKRIREHRARRIGAVRRVCCCVAVTADGHRIRVEARRRGRGDREAGARGGVQRAR